MSEFRFFAFTDFEYRTNGTSSFINLPFALSTKSTAPYDDEMSEDLNVPYTVFEILVAVFAVVGNLMVIIVFQRERKLRRRTNYYIVSLAIADFLVGSLGVPFAILSSVGKPENLYACLFTVSLLVVLCTISIFCLVAVSVDRYWAILYPMAYSRNVRTKTAIVIISLCWVAGTVVGFLPLFGWHADVQTQHTCHFVKVMDYSYLVFLYFATIITPALLMLAFYAHIYRVIVKQVRQIITMNPVSDCSRRSSTAQIQVTPSRPCHGGTMLRVLGASRKRDVKATQNLSIIVLFFMICWFPLYTINCIKAFCPDCEVHPKLTLFCIILSHLNSAGNPVLYAYHLKDFRLALKNLILKIMGVDLEPPLDPMHRFSLASQHRLQSIDASMRNSLQPRIYIDSPIWLRQQQQQALKKPQLTPKCGVIPCLNNINQTVAAVASVPTEIERDMWNIVEASSGAEIDEVNYAFPAVEDKCSNTPPASITQRNQCGSVSLDRSDSPYSYNNCNYLSGSDEIDLDEVFLPNKITLANEKIENTTASGDGKAAVQHNEVNSALIACAMRNKLRSDDIECQQRLHSSHHLLTDSSHSDYDVANLCSSALQSPAAVARLSTHASKSTQDHGGGGGIEGGGGGASSSLSSSSNSCLHNAAIYVIESDTNPLSPSHKRKYKKSQRLPMGFSKTTKNISPSCSCTSDTSTPTKELSTMLATATPTTTTTATATATTTRKHSNSLSSSNSLNAAANGVAVVAADAAHRNSNNNNTQQANNLNYHTYHQQQAHHLHKDTHHNPHTLQCHHGKFSPLRAVSQLIFPPIVKHSSLFQLFQPSASSEHVAHNATAAFATHTTTTNTTTTTTAAVGGTAVSTATPPTACESRIASADESVCTTVTEVMESSLTPPVMSTPPPLLVTTNSK